MSYIERPYRHTQRWDQYPEVVPNEQSGLPLAQVAPSERIGGYPETVHNRENHQTESPLPAESSWIEKGSQQRTNALRPIPLYLSWWKLQWKRRDARLCIIISVVIILCTIIAGSVGGTLAKKKKPSSAKTTPSETPSAASLFGTPTSFPPPLPDSICRGTMCPQLLATAQFGDPATMFLFSRGADNAIWYRRANESAWETEWTSLGGAFASAPAAVSIRTGRVDVFGVADDGTAKTKSFSSGIWDAEWTELAGECVTQATTISFGLDKLSLICVEPDSSLGLKFWKRGEWGPDQLGDWEDLGKPLTSTPALDSGGDERVDIVGYGIRQGPGPVSYPMCFKRHFGGGIGWREKGFEDCWGSFKGDPAVVSLGPNRSEYFGVATDGTIGHITWNLKPREESNTTKVIGTNAPADHPTEFSPPINLGGKFETAPFAMAGVESDRLDVLAVGEDDRLKHKARIAGVWADEWDDLGGYFNSAPLALMIGRSNKVAVFGLGPNGSVIHGLFTIGDGPKWEGSWFSDGGSMSSSWLRQVPA